MKKTPQNRGVFFMSSNCNEVIEKKAIGYNSFRDTRLSEINTRQSLLDNLFELDLALGIHYQRDEKSLIVSRDIFGFTSVYFIFEPNEGFVFSNDINKLVAIREYKDKVRPNNNFISDYLTPWKIAYTTNSRTAYTNIHTLLPGHYLIVTENDLKVKNYLSFQPEKFEDELLANSHSTFKSLFLHSISRLVENSAHSVGTHLSGGLDSSSIACGLRHIYPNRLISSYFFDTDTSSCFPSNDKKLADLISSRISSSHNIINADFSKSFDFTYAHIKKLGQPPLLVSGPNQSMLIKQQARAQGVDLLLSGHGGDSVVGHGSEFIQQLFYQKKWEELRFFLGQSNSYALNFRPGIDWDKLSFQQKGEVNFNTYVFQQLKRKKDFKYAITVLASINSIKTWQDSFLQFFEWIAARPFRKKIDRSTFVNSGLLADSNEMIYQFDDIEMLAKYNASLKPLYGYFTVRINEELSVMDQLSNVNERYPFYDKDLVEYCISVPLREKYNNGFTRGPLRKGLSEILPQELLTRKDKHAFDLYSIQYTLAMYNSCKTDFLHDKSEVWTYANKLAFDKAIWILNNSQTSLHKSAMKTFVLRVINLAIWLSLK